MKTTAKHNIKQNNIKHNFIVNLNYHILPINSLGFCSSCPQIVTTYTVVAKMLKAKFYSWHAFLLQKSLHEFLVEASRGYLLIKYYIQTGKMTHTEKNSFVAK